MAVRITVRLNGSYLVDIENGALEIVDHEGNPIPLPEGKTKFSLCRCGASSRKPFCDGTHTKIGFVAAEAARKEFDARQG